jgi:hypothetical protein
MELSCEEYAILITARGVISALSVSFNAGSKAGSSYVESHGMTCCRLSKTARKCAHVTRNACFASVSVAEGLDPGDPRTLVSLGCQVYC